MFAVYNYLFLLWKLNYDCLLFDTIIRIVYLWISNSSIKQIEYLLNKRI